MTITKILIMGAVVSILLSCGMQELAEDARTLSAEANEGVAESNQTSKEMLLLQIKMLEYMQRTDEMTQALKTMSEDSIDKLNLTIEQMRRQSVAIAIEGMLNPNNSVNLDPPTKLIPYAKTYAEDANEAEIAEFAYAVWHDVAYGSAPRSEKEKFLTAMALVGAFVSKAKMENIQRIQIDQKEKYEEVTYKLLWGRYVAVRDLHFLSLIEEAATLNKGSLKEAIIHFKVLQELAGLSYVAKLRVSIPLMITDQVTPSELNTLATTAKNNFNSKMTAGDLLDPEVIELLKTFNL